MNLIAEVFQFFMPLRTHALLLLSKTFCYARVYVSSEKWIDFKFEISKCVVRLQ